MSVLVLHLGAGVLGEGAKKRLDLYLRGLLEDSGGVESLSSLVSFIERIEGDGATNCGVGSNRTREGVIENEASIMHFDGTNGCFAGVTQVPSAASAIQEAHNLLCAKELRGRSKTLTKVFAPPPLEGSVAPSSRGSPSRGPPPSTSTSAGKARRRAEPSDTVGAILCLPGLLVSASTTGGTADKERGRVGPCALYMGTVFANEVMGICVSGTGESITKSGIVRRIKGAIEDKAFHAVEEVLKEYIEENRDFPYLGGVALVRRGAEVWMLHFQTAPSFIFGYRRSGETVIKSVTLNPKSSSSPYIVEYLRL